MPEVLEYGLNDLISYIEDLYFDEVIKTQYYYETLNTIQSFARGVEKLKQKMKVNLDISKVDDPESQNWNFWMGHIRAIDIIQKGEE